MNLVKKLLLLIAVVLVFFIAAGLLLPIFIDVNDYKSKIEQLVEDNIGRKLTLEGDLELKTFPFLKVKTGQLALANPDGFPRQNMLEIKSAEVGIRLLPLIFKKVEAGTIKFDSPVINLTQKSNGETNWAFNTDNQPAEENNEQTQSESALAAIAVQGFEISSAQINFADLSSDTIVSVTDLNLRTGSIIPGSSFPVEISAQLQGSILPEPVQATLDSDVVIDSALENLTINEFKSVINQSQSNYEINSPLISLDIPNNQLAIATLEFKDLTDPNTTTQLLIDKVDVDLNSLLVSLDMASADFVSAQLKAQLKLPGIQFDANTSKASIDSAALLITHPQLEGEIELPETAFDLSHDDISVQALKGKLRHKNLNAELSIPEISVNKDTLEINVNAIETVIGESRLTTGVHGALAPLSINFDLKTDNLNLKSILASLDTDLNTAKASALTNLDLDVSGLYAENNLKITQLNGQLDETTINASASMVDFNSPAYQLDLNLGDLAIDDYLPQPTTDKSQSTSQSAAAAAGAPVGLSQFNVVAAITANRIYSQNNNIALENLSLKLAPDKDKTSISFESILSGEVLPEALTLNLNTLARVNPTKNNVELNALQIKAQGKTINSGINIPSLTAPMSAENINIENITASFSNSVANSELTIPGLSYDTAKSYLVIKNVTGKGSFNDIDANIILPNLSVALDSQSLKVNELALDLSGSKPVGRLSVPTLDVDLTNKTLGPTNIIFEGQDGRAQVNLKPTDGSNNYSGNLLANDFNLRGILNRFNVLSDLEDKSALTRINIQSPITFSQSKLKLENIKANIDDTSISGHVNATFGLNPVYTFAINVGNLNADRYIPPASESQSTNSTKAVAAPVAIPVELFKETTANGDLHFDNLQIGGAQFSNFNIGVTSKDGKLSISPIKSNFFNGTMNGSLGIDSSGKTPRLDFDYALSGVALEPALSSLGVTDKLAGKGDFQLNMAATGETDKAMTASVKGASSLNINNGTLKGINLQDILFKGYQTYASLKNKTVNSKYNPADQTEFSSMSGSWAINAGIISGEDLIIQAPLFRIDGKGQVSLINNTIDYLLNVKVVKSLEGQGGKSMKELEGRTIPLSITGSLTAPQYRLDVSALVKAEARKKAEEKIQEKIEDKLGEKLEGEGTLQEKLQKKAVEKAGEKLLDLFNKF